MPEDLSEAAATVLRAHLLPRLASYCPSLALAVEAAENGWLPAEGDARIAVLRQFTGPGEPPLDDDPFFLRVGLVVPGLQRGVRPPLLVLSESRGGLSMPRLEEAAAQVARLTEALTIGRLVLPGLSPSGEQGTRTLLEVLRESRVDVGREVDPYLRLTPPDVASVASVALAFVDSHHEAVRSIGADLLQRLACFRFEPLGQEVLAAALSRELCWPASIYRDAPDGIADALLMLFERSTNDVARSQLLRALAWTRSPRAHNEFLAWSASPPPWSAQLLVPPGDYPPTAGWSIDAKGSPRDLTSATCFQLRPAEENEGGAVKCFEIAGGKCPTCRTRLSWLFEFGAVDLSRLGVAWVAAPKRVLTCLVCARYGVVFADYTEKETSLHRPAVAVENAEDEWVPKPLTRFVSSSPFPPFAAAEAFSVQDASTLGGAPGWLQDAEIPRCPRCRMDMLFLAQFDNGSLNEEGIYYAFFCGDCRISAVAYQQT